MTTPSFVDTVMALFGAAAPTSARTCALICESDAPVVLGEAALLSVGGEAAASVVAFDGVASLVVGAAAALVESLLDVSGLGLWLLLEVAADATRMVSSESRDLMTLRAVFALSGLLESSLAALEAGAGGELLATVGGGVAGAGVKAPLGSGTLAAAV